MVGVLYKKGEIWISEYGGYRYGWLLLTLLARLNAIKRKNPLALLTEKVGLVIQLDYVASL